MYNTGETYPIEVDACGWPESLPEVEREPLKQAVREILAWAERPLDNGEIYDFLKYDRFKTKFHPLVPSFYKACLWDFLFACIDRACRGCKLYKRWTPDKFEETVYGKWTVTCGRVADRPYFVTAQPEGREERYVYRCRSVAEVNNVAKFLRSNKHALAAAWERGTPVPAAKPEGEGKTLAEVFAKEESDPS